MAISNSPKDDVLPIYKPNQTTGSPYIQFTEEVSPFATSAAAAASSKATANYIDTANADMVQNVADANAAVNPQASQGGFYLLNAIGSGLANVWSSWIGKVALIGVAAGIAALLYNHFSSGSSASTSQEILPATVHLTTAQASQDQTQLANQLSATAKTLKSAGYDATVVDSEKNFTQLSAGTAIQLAITPSPSSGAGNPEMAKAQYVVGSHAPSDYVPVSQVPVAAYLNTLSQNPSPSDLQKNADVIHGDTEVNR